MSHYFAAQSPELDQPRQVEVVLRGHRLSVTTDSGVFSSDRLDPGTAVLLDQVPEPPMSGTFCDVGCGWGPLALALAQAAPAARVLAVDVNPRALTLTKKNADAHGYRVQTHTPDDLLGAEPDLTVDLIWSNPPIRIGKQNLHTLLRTWLPRLSPQGAAYLVVSKNLGGDSLHRWIESELGQPTTRLASRQGFRILHVAAITTG
ncbi:MAG: class I SAM-dependent methyltransferase [Beutenbergiaceae bacterium]